MLLLGFVAVLFPFFSSLTASVFVGALMLVGSVLRLFNLEPKSGSKEWWLEGLGGVLGVLAAGLILIFPLTGAITLTLLVGAYFFAQALLRFMTAWSVDRHRTWFVVSGILDLGLSLLVVLGWPGTGLWVLGILLGVHLVMMGLIMLTTPREVLEAAPGVPVGRSDGEGKKQASADERIDTALAETFPASDPPGYGPR